MAGIFKGPPERLPRRAVRGLGAHSPHQTGTLRTAAVEAGSGEGVLRHRTHGSQTYDVSYTYDAAGRMKTLTTSGAAGPAVTTWNYVNDRLTSKVYDDGKGPQYTYTAAGRLSTRLWARGITTTYGCNNAGDLNQVTYSDSTPTVSGMQYDGMGGLISVTDASGSRTIARSASGQLANESWSSGLFAGAAVSCSYDSNERLSTLSVTGTNGSLIGEEVTYDYAGQRIVSVSTDTGYTATQQWTGSRLGNTVHSQSGGATITMGRGYDGLNRLVTAGAVGANTAYEYNSLNQRTRATRSADGSYFDYGYDALGQVTSGARRWSDGTQVPGEQFGYAFDGIGNRTTATRNNRVSTYTPNKLNQYTQRTIPDKVDVTGKAEPAATITVDGQAATRSQDGWFWNDVTLNNAASPAFKNILIQSSGGTAPLTETAPGFLPQTPEAFTQDDDGNLTQDGRYTYTWDGENRLIAIETRAAAIAAGTPGVHLVMEYDNQSRRLSTGVSRRTGTAFEPIYKLLHHYDDWNLVAESLEQGTPVRSYIWGPDLSGNLRGAGGVGGLLRMTDLTSEDGNSYAYTYDGNGNVTNLWDLADSTVAATYRYGAFGETLEATGTVAEFNPVRFSTKCELPESVGLLYYGYRFYNPETGRWLSRDPMDERGGLNLHVFVRNDGCNDVDYLGLRSRQDCLAKINSLKTHIEELRDYFSNNHCNAMKAVLEAFESGGSCVKWSDSLAQYLEEPRSVYDERCGTQESEVDPSPSEAEEVDERNAKSYLVAAGLITAGVVIVIIDVATVPSGEGACGLALIKWALKY